MVCLMVLFLLLLFLIIFVVAVVVFVVVTDIARKYFFSKISFLLSNSPQVSMGYRLINHGECCWNTRRIYKSRAAGE